MLILLKRSEDGMVGLVRIILKDKRELGSDDACPNIPQARGGVRGTVEKCYYFNKGQKMEWSGLSGLY
jgi:hypothetical protein